MADLVTQVKEGNTIVILARIAGVDGSDIVQSSLSSLTWTLTRQDTGEAVVSAETLTISSQVFNTLQTFIYPTGRTFSYNFKHVISGSYLTEGNVKYMAVYTFTDANSYPYKLDVDISVENIP